MTSPRLRSFLRSHLQLITIGIGCELLYLLYFVWQFPLLRYYRGLTDLGGITSHSSYAFGFFVFIFIVLFGLFSLALRQVRNMSERATLWLILAFGGLFALTMTFVYPITAIDIFNYIAQSLILVQYHADPTIMPAAHYAHDPLMALSGGWGRVGAPYGPLGIMIDALPTLISGRNILANLLLLKLLFSSLFLVEAFLVYKIVSRFAPEYALSGALFVAWNPLVLFECSVNGHNDIAMMLFVLLAVLALLEDRPVFALVSLTASALIKSATVILIPLFFMYSMMHQSTHRERFRFAILTCLSSLAYVCVIYIPFWHGIETFQHFLSQDQYYLDSLSSVLANLFSMSITHEQAKLLGRVLFLPFYAYALWLSRRSLPDLLCGCFLCTFFLLAFATSYFEVWYVLWPIVLVSLLPRRPERLATLLLACGATLSAAVYSYLWGRLGSFTLANNVSYFMSFAPALLSLLVFTLRYRWRALLKSVMQT